jgi:hypothetical protein
VSRARRHPPVYEPEEAPLALAQDRHDGGSRATAPTTARPAGRGCRSRAARGRWGCGPRRSSRWPCAAGRRGGVPCRSAALRRAPCGPASSARRWPRRMYGTPRVRRAVPGPTAGHPGARSTRGPAEPGRRAARACRSPTVGEPDAPSCRPRPRRKPSRSSSRRSARCACAATPAATHVCGTGGSMAWREAVFTVGAGRSVCGRSEAAGHGPCRDPQNPHASTDARRAAVVARLPGARRGPAPRPTWP